MAGLYFYFNSIIMAIGKTIIFVKAVPNMLRVAFWGYYDSFDKYIWFC